MTKILCPIENEGCNAIKRGVCQAKEIEMEDHDHDGIVCGYVGDLDKNIRSFKDVVLSEEQKDKMKVINLVGQIVRKALKETMKKGN